MSQNDLRSEFCRFTRRLFDPHSPARRLGETDANDEHMSSGLTPLVLFLQTSEIVGADKHNLECCYLRHVRGN